MKIKFFASLRERLKCDEVEWQDSSDLMTVADIVSKLVKQGDIWATTLGEGKVLIAVNQEMANLKTPVQANDEIAFFPPVTGG